MSDIEFMREQAARCRRLAFSLRDTEPARQKLLDMADEFELKAIAQPPPPLMPKPREIIPFEPPAPSED